MAQVARDACSILFDLIFPSFCCNNHDLGVRLMRICPGHTNGFLAYMLGDIKLDYFSLQ